MIMVPSGVDRGLDLVVGWSQIGRAGPGITLRWPGVSRGPLALPGVGLVVCNELTATWLFRRITIAQQSSVGVCSCFYRRRGCNFGRCARARHAANRPYPGPGFNWLDSFLGNNGSGSGASTELGSHRGRFYNQNCARPAGGSIIRNELFGASQFAARPPYGGAAVAPDTILRTTERGGK